MAPSRLDHPNLRVGKKVDRSLKQIPRRDKIRVENAYEFPGGRFQSTRQGASFETSAIDPLNQLNVITALAQFFRARGGNFAGIIRRIIENLDLKKVARIIELAD